MVDPVFAHPFMYWVGMETDPRITPAALAEFNQFYSTTHVHEVIAAHPGFVSASRYELVDPDPRGGVHHGPRWLAVYGMADEASAVQYVKDNERPWLHRRKYSPWPAARKKAKIVWRMLWRQLSATDSTDHAPETIVLVGTNQPDVTPQADAHFELYREYAHQPPGCPRFCAIFDATAADVPPVSDERDASWRLVYRLMRP
jgi:hypothetical protein